MFDRFGVRGRLLFAFFGISAFAVLATVGALYAFLELSQVLERVTERRARPRSRPSNSPAMLNV